MVGLVAGWAAVPAHAAGVEYVVDAGRSSVVVKTRKAGMAAGLAHNHVVAARDFSGTVRFDPESDTTAQVEVVVNTATLVVDDPALRRKHGEATVVGPGDRAKVKEAMDAEDQLDVAHHPTARFRSTGVTPQRDGSLLVQGDLTVRGVTRPVRLATRPALRDGFLVAAGEVTFKQSDHGISPYSSFMGAVRNQDEVTLLVELVAKPRPTVP
jgi:polyisoprenoid-binding protein YceI